MKWLTFKLIAVAQIYLDKNSNHVSQQALGLIHEIVIRGYTPIMAHPERNIAIQKSPKLLEELADEGILFQLTAQCFTKGRRNMHEADKLAWKIVQDGMCTVIASDAHNTTTRQPGLISAYDKIAERLGQPTADRLIENANSIWEGQPVETVIPSKRRWLAPLFR